MKTLSGVFWILVVGISYAEAQSPGEIVRLDTGVTGVFFKKTPISRLEMQMKE